MSAKRGSHSLRWLTVLALAVAGLPIWLSWRATEMPAGETAPPVEQAVPSGQSWAEPDEIEVQFRPGAGSDAIKAADDRLGVTPEWSAPQPDPEEIDSFRVPAGASA